MDNLKTNTKAMEELVIDSFLKSPDSDLEYLQLLEMEWEALMDFGLVLRVRI